MRRFYRAYGTGHDSHVMYVVIDDGERQFATVAELAAAADQTRMLADIPYAGIGRGRACKAASRVAKRLAAGDNLAVETLVDEAVALERAEAAASTGLTVGGDAAMRGERR